MPSSTHPATYEAEYHALLHETLSKGKKIIPLPNLRAGQRMRLRIYGLRAALRKNPKGFEAIASLSQTIQIRLIEEPPTLILSLSSISDDATLLRKALENQDEPTEEHGSRISPQDFFRDPD